jgi:hypothetical protein
MRHIGGYLADACVNEQTALVDAGTVGLFNLQTNFSTAPAERTMRCQAR